LRASPRLAVGGCFYLKKRPATCHTELTSAVSIGLNSGNRSASIPVSSAAGSLSRGSQPLGTRPQPVDDPVSDPAFFAVAIKDSDHLLVIIDLLLVERTPTSLVADHDPVAPCFEQLKLRSNFFDLPHSVLNGWVETEVPLTEINIPILTTTAPAR